MNYRVIENTELAKGGVRPTLLVAPQGEFIMRILYDQKTQDIKFDFEHPSYFDEQTGPGANLKVAQQMLDEDLKGGRKREVRRIRLPLSLIHI